MNYEPVSEVTEESFDLPLEDLTSDDLPDLEGVTCW